MQLERLRLAGFKSFVEPTELTIGPGLTGIVGPNGCGKSNLVEALRWVMGEASARRLRGGEMDDVIFGGSGNRPARNLAEVALTLDNGTREAPFAFNDGVTIEVARRIVRGAGSTYRVNGREARARDVQLLFADAASGPHSGALVGQGRVGALVAAKPSERRALLDEAAGTAGLQTRRHEAELKLQAAEANLVRLDDVVATLAAQTETLNKQARQARRYRRLGEQIREAETQLLAARWTAAAAENEALAAQLRAAERKLAASVETASACERERGDADAALPPLRLARASAAAAVQRLTHAREVLEQESRRAAAARAEAERRLGQAVSDLAREADHFADANTMLARLASEHETLDHADAVAAKTRADATAQSEAAAAALVAAERGLQQMTEACATGEAKRAALERQHRDLAERLRRLGSQLAEEERRRRPLAATSVPAEALAEGSAAVAAASTAVEEVRAASAAAAEALALKQKGEAEAADIAREAERLLGQLNAEADALGRLLPQREVSAAGGTHILAQLGVPPGLEAATAALFDGELSAAQIEPSLPPGAPNGAGWLELPPLAAVPLPEGAHPLADKLAAPPVLTRRMAFAGWVETPQDGWRLQPHLVAGQCLVDREGRLWRWDGFVRLEPGSTATAEQLRQRNRLDWLASEIVKAAANAASAAAQAAAARAERDAAVGVERSATTAVRAAEDKLSRARNTEADLARRRLAAETQLAAINASIEKTITDLAETEQQAAAAAQALARLPDLSLARSALEAARSEAAAARRRDGEARAALDRIGREAGARRQRLAAITAEDASWQKRHEAAAAQAAMLTERRTALDAEIAELAARPAAIAAESEALAQQASAAAAKDGEADDALAGAEARLRHAAEAARRAEAAVAEARERRAGLAAHCEAAAAALAQLGAEIAERLGASPEHLATLAAADGGTANAENLATRLDRLLRERDGMGPVNLLAEQEAEEVTGRLAGLERERTDLTEAIARLRRGIGTLDREARSRIVAAFEQLNGHFGELFGRLFGGGKAELAWAGDDDPLAAGLEILASPPGKRLDSLSLLSGGEQALTALALIFAMFLTNPAPVCVLDEVDAPLDDANVDGFCRLVADIADTTGTRFLLVTHHRVTMARMDRLFGVTMAERGVSQLVSVDLARAAELRQTA